jgi:putative oxidoreductase
MKSTQINTIHRYLELFFRFGIGVSFVLFGLSKFHAFMPTPPMQPQAAKFIAALVETGYLWTMLGFFEVLGGSLIFTGGFLGWGLIILSPIVINIIAYLLVLQTGIGFPPIAMSAFLGIGMIYLGIRNRNLFLGIYK